MDMLKEITERTLSTIKQLFREGCLRDAMISDYGEMSRGNLHSWLQYAVISSGSSLGLIPVPEIKLYYKKSLDPKIFGLEGKRKGTFKKVDVGLYNGKVLTGFAEVYTMDMAHGAAKIDDQLNPWLSPRISLTHLAENSIDEPGFCLLLNALPEKAEMVQWKTTKSKHGELKETRDYFSAFNTDWCDLIDELNESFPTKMITVLNSEKLHLHP